MAAASLAAPGTEYGPCEGTCEHTDCAATRRMAEAPCVRCREPIGYDVAFFREEGGDPYTEIAHAKCVYAALEEATA